MAQICFDRQSFTLYIVMVISLMAFIVYSITNMNKAISLNIPQIIQHPQERRREPPSIQSVFLDKIHNPLEPPEKRIPTGSFNKRGYDANNIFQQTGFISGASGRYPIFSRYHEGRSDRKEYYTIDDSRGRIKIPIQTRNYSEIFDGDKIVIPELNGEEFTFTEYENEGLRYNPVI